MARLSSYLPSRVKQLLVGLVCALLACADEAAARSGRGAPVLVQVGKIVLDALVGATLQMSLEGTVKAAQPESREVWAPGRPHPQHANVIAGNVPGNWQPAPGFAWTSDSNTNFDVLWVPERRVGNLISGTSPGQWRPAPGFRWVAPDVREDLRVYWQAGVRHPSHHVVSGSEAGSWIPEPGYQARSPADPEDLHVEWKAGLRHPQFTHTIAAATEGQWHPEEGHRWSDPEDEASLDTSPLNGTPPAAGSYDAVVTTQLLIAAADAGFTGRELAYKPVVGHLSRHEGSQRHRVLLAAGRSHLIVAACDEDCDDADLRLFDENDNMVDRDTGEDDRPTVSVVPSWTGEFEVEISLPGCHVTPCAYGLAVFSRDGS